MTWQKTFLLIVLGLILVLGVHSLTRLKFDSSVHEGDMSLNALVEDEAVNALRAAHEDSQPTTISTEGLSEQQVNKHIRAKIDEEHYKATISPEMHVIKSGKIEEQGKIAEASILRVSNEIQPRFSSSPKAVGPAAFSDPSIGSSVGIEDKLIARATAQMDDQQLIAFQDLRKKTVIRTALGQIVDMSLRKTECAKAAPSNSCTPQIINVASGVVVFDGRKWSAEYIPTGIGQEVVKVR